MGAEQNKEIVRRFWDDLIVKGNVEVADELLSPDYVNLIVEGLSDSQPAPPEHDARSDVEVVKAAVAAYHATVSDVQLEVLAMAAEGDAVFARFQITATGSDGTTTTSRALGYYRVRDSKIVMNDILSVSV